MLEGFLGEIEQAPRAVPRRSLSKLVCIEDQIDGKWPADPDLVELPLNAVSEYRGLDIGSYAASSQWCTRTR
jgi:hypothetical protein